MNTPKTCPQCGKELPVNTVRGLCPKCLALVALADDGDQMQPTTPSPAGVGSTKASAEPTLKSTVRYFGDYELLEEIARGGMGVVFKARQVSLNRIVAVKMILSGQLASEAEVRRFRIEAEAAANLQHPNIVAIHEVGEHEGRHYFSMDYVEGKNLADFTKDDRLPVNQAVQLVKTLAEAVHFAHQRGTLHRDLKPQNVLMDAAGRPRITDFGLAKHIEKDSSLTRTGAALGSPNYMPPEQAAGRLNLVGPASDVYSLGIMLYELLTTLVPFRAATPMATMVKVMEDEPVSPRKLNPSVPADLEAVCLKCLEKRPERRYHSAQALAEELARFLNHEPVQAKPASAMRKAANWSLRHPWVLAGAASLLMLGLLVFAYGLWERNQYLTYVNAHPGYVRARGASSAEVFHFVFWVYGCLAFCRIVYRARSKGLTLRELYDPSKRMLARRRPVSPGLLLICGLCGVTGISFGTYEVVKCIDAWVWDAPWSTWPLSSMIIVYGCFSIATMLLWEVLREYFGFQPLEGLSQDQLDRVNAAIYAGRILEATQLYRESTGEKFGQARAVVENFVSKLYREHPERFAADPTKPKPLDVGRFLMLFVVGAILLAMFSGSLYGLGPLRTFLAMLGGEAFGVAIALAEHRWNRRLGTARTRFLTFLTVFIFVTGGVLFSRVTIVLPSRTFTLPALRFLSFLPPLSGMAFLLGIFVGLIVVWLAVKRRE